MIEDWFKSPRCIIHEPVFDNPKLFKVWYWCMAKASYKDKKIVIGKQIVELQAGQFIFGRLKAADQLKMNDRTLYDYMKTLVKLGELRMKSNNKFTIVTIVKWGIYQGLSTENQQQTNNNATTDQQQTNTNKKEKKGKKEKNNNEQTPNSKFNNFTGRDYDMNKLEVGLIEH